MRIATKFTTTKFTALPFLFLLILATPILAQDKAAKIDQLISTYHDYGQFNGAVLVAQNGEILFKKGYGLAHMEWDIPNEADTKFRLGSITKQFTATLIMQLEENGKLSTDDVITDHLTEYPDEVGGKVTIHHLLTHTSGIPSYTGLPDFFADKSRDPYSVEEFIEVFSDLPLEFEPGSEYRYNNSGYFLLGAIIEEATGMTYEEALAQYIFEPLGMEDSGYDHHGTILKKRAAGYERAGIHYRTAPYLDMSLPYAAGSLYSTVEDLFIWDRALAGDKVLSAGQKEKMLTDYINGYGYGWGVNEGRTFGDKDVTVVGHGGGINGFNTLIQRIPEDGHMVVLLNNTGGTNLGGMSAGVFEILYGGEADQPVKPISTEMAVAIEKKGVEKAVVHYKKLREENADAYDFREEELNRLGYYYLEEGEMETAIAVFKLNTEAYPEAFNTYDSLGEAYMKAGDTDLAVANYQKSLEFNPRNENAKEMLAEMGVQVDEALGAEITVDAEILKGYVGKFQLQPGFVITVTQDDTQLFAQATGQPQFEIFAESETKFFLKVVDAQITFQVGDDGVAESITLHQGGRNMPAKRIE